MEKLISVIVPIYKIEPYLEECIESVINQTYKNLEIILVDDGSPDKCGEICDRYAKADSRIKVIHKENGGISDARNVGVAAATGELIGFVDGDDYIDHGFFEKLFNTMSENNSDISECGCIRFNEGEVPKAYYEGNYKILSPFSWLTESGLNGFFTYVLWNKLYRRSLFDGILFPVGRRFEDEAVLHQVICKANRVARTESKIYFYRQRENSITHNVNIIRDINEKLMALNERCQFFKEKNEISIALFAEAKRNIYIIAKYKHIRCFAKDYKEYYRTVRNSFFDILKCSAVPLKYKAYISAFVLCPFIFAK